MLTRLKAKAIFYHSYADLLETQPPYIAAMINYLLALHQYLGIDDYSGLGKVLEKMKKMIVPEHKDILSGQELPQGYCI
jgi:hypothetical protein